MPPQCSAETLPVIGVVIVSFRSGDVILECLESLLAVTDAPMRIVVVDNASPDDTCERIAAWAAGSEPFLPKSDSPVQLVPAPKPLPLAIIDEDGTVGPPGRLTLVRARVNRGYAGGVNLGLRILQGHVAAYWILNPDCVVGPDAPRAYRDALIRSERYGLMSCRTLHYSHPDVIQSDGGYVDRQTGVCHQINARAPEGATSPPDPGALEWLTGANLLVSQAFLDQVGPMEDDYFLYYEEVDWAFRRGDLPLVMSPEGRVYHHAGTSIGSGAYERRPLPFANYFNHRNRIRFARRRLGGAGPLAYAYSLAKAAQLVLKGAPDEAWAIIAGTFELKPPREVSEKFTDPETRALALGRSHTVR
jgi:GT2 family glycosyltransferase